ncbi:MAG: glycogen debranching protein GlgX [Actinomycetia bacterium]|nr:glycogen debranching protein GlgX [Actinomycetes bacterium]
MTNTQPSGRARRPDVWLGQPQPLGATWDGEGTNFAVFSEGGYAVELSLFDGDAVAGSEIRIEIPEHTANVHHVYLPGIGPGQRYGYRVHGPWDPGQGLRFNPAKLLVDPYAKAIEGQVDWAGPVFGHDAVDSDRPDHADSAASVPRSIVVDTTFDWGDDAPPRTPWYQTVIYEGHVRGLTMTHPEVPDELRGTYAGMACEPVIDHLVDLGVTAIELMPIHHFVPEGFIVDLGLTNYWGYSTLGFFAPHGPYAAAGDGGQQVNEFKGMVKAFHRAGIEVLLDVVYNHTTEGTAEGPTLSFRGLDNTTYYRLAPDNSAHYLDFTGTGNSLNVTHAASLQLVMDSLRYWLEEMHVDGFRFDLAPTLAREYFAVDRNSAFFDLIQQDPVVARAKLIAEPWDVGPGGYQIGNFPPLWSEWNGRYRDDVRDYWKGSDGSLSGLASRFSGSSDLYGFQRRRPRASINFVTAHDGYTLHDLVAYEHKHNVANGERNRDGHSDNRSWNGGAEGPTDDPDIVENRRRRAAAMMTTLLLSQGVPMICGGDEMGRTQRGNNNAYCQDNEISWTDWTHVDNDMLALTKYLIEFRRQHPVFRRRRFFTGSIVDGSPLPDIGWYKPDGSLMHHDDWQVGYARAVAVFLNGSTIADQGPRLDPVVDDSFLVLFNAGIEPLSFTIPYELTGSRWSCAIDSSLHFSQWGAEVNGRGDQPVRDWKAGAWSVVVLRRDETGR